MEKIIDNYNPTEMDYKADHTTEVLAEGAYKGYQFKIISYGTHPCAYVRIPRKNGLGRVNFYDISVHGGITLDETFSEDCHIGKAKERWIGWDYAHAGDYIGYHDIFQKEKKWTVSEIFEHVVSVIEELNKRYGVISYENS